MTLGGITQGPDGNLWFTEGEMIGRITPTGTIREFPFPGAFATDITAGADGNLWVGTTGARTYAV